MALFLLAFCYDGNSPDALHDTQILNERCGDCWKSVIPGANPGEMKEKLGK